MGPSARSRLLDLPIPKKLGLIIGVFSVIVCCVLALSYFGFAILSGVRGYVGGEGLWSKAQKDAIYQLRKYAKTRDESDYRQFLEYLEVPLGDARARIELDMPDTNRAIVYQGFTDGRIAADDHKIMSDMFEWFRHAPYMSTAIDIWAEADANIVTLISVADSLRTELRQERPSQERIQLLLAEVDRLNIRLTLLEDNFSYTLGEAARWIRKVLMGVMLGVTVMFLGFGVWLSSLISRHLINAIYSLRVGADLVARGDYRHVIAIESNDEIGELANNFRQMATARHEAELALVERARERDEANQKLIDAERIKAAFFANISHELRTPLALILGPAGKLMQAFPDPLAPARRDLDVISRNARTLLKHVNDLLDVSKLEAGKMTVVYRNGDLARLFRYAASHFEVLAAERDVAFSLDAPAELPAQFDAEKLQRVLLNLLSNAFKFTPTGGKIHGSLLATEENVTLTVADSGPGVHPEEREHIFERFRQADHGMNRNFGGTGLGLAIAKDFVELHGGRITAGESGMGGALFTVMLPLHAPTGVNVFDAPDEQGLATDHAAQQALDELRTRIEAVASMHDNRDRPRVLVVEDNPEMNRFIAEALATEYRVEQAYDGQQGFEKAIDLHPDLILSDVMMPRVSGDTLVKNIRSHLELDAIPIVLLTAKADDDLRVALLREGAQDYVMKPFAIDEVRARVRNLITTKRARDVLQRELTSQIGNIETLAKEVSQRKRELETAAESMRVARDHAEKSSQHKSDFLNLVSHELRTPLTALLLHLQRLQRDPDATGKHQEMAARMSTSASRLMGLVDSLLDYSRLKSGKLEVKQEPFDLREVVAAALAEVAPQAELKNLAVRYEANAPFPVVGDRKLLHLVIINLVGNAIKYTDRGHIDVLTERDEREFRVGVRDTGPGIAPEHHAKFFEPFSQLETIDHKHLPGVGLGLSMVKQIVTSLGGRIELESEVGVGSTFVAVFPLAVPS